MVLRGVLKFFFGVLWLLLIILLVVGVGGYFAARSVDPNIFRTELEKYLTQQTGMRVELGNIALKWGVQLRLQLDGLKFYNPKSLEKLLQSDSVMIEADMASLWRKKLWMPRIVILNPEVFIKKRADGYWNWQPEAGSVQAPQPALAAAAAPAKNPPKEPIPGTAVKAAKTETPARPLWEFGFGNIEIRDGTLQYIDETIQPAYTVQIVKCEVEILPKASLSAFHGVLRGMVWQTTERKIEMEGDLDLIAKVLDFKVRYDRDRAYLKGVLKLVRAIPHFEGLLRIQDLDLETLVPDAYKNGEYVTGILNSDLQLSVDGGNPEFILKSLHGKGKADITNGSLRNRNIIREILEKMSPVIAVTALFGGELPPEISELMKGPNTDFLKAAVTFSAARGAVTVQEFYFEHPDYQLSGKGGYGLLNKQIDLMASLKFSRPISEYFVKKIHELEVLCYPGGLLIIPFRYSGTVPHAAVMPDLQYIGNRLLQVSAQQLLDKGLQRLSKIFEPKTAEAKQ